MIRCDFCNSEFEATRAHQVTAPAMAIVAPGVTMGYSPMWAACDVCYARLLNHDYSAIIADVINTIEDEAGMCLPAVEIEFISAVLLSCYSHLSINQ